MLPGELCQPREPPRRPGGEERSDANFLGLSPGIGGQMCQECVSCPGPLEVGHGCPYVGSTMFYCPSALFSGIAGFGAPSAGRQLVRMVVRTVVTRARVICGLYGLFGFGVHFVFMGAPGLVILASDGVGLSFSRQVFCEKARKHWSSASALKSFWPRSRIPSQASRIVSGMTLILKRVPSQARGMLLICMCWSS